MALWGPTGVTRWGSGRYESEPSGGGSGSELDIMVSCSRNPDQAVCSLRYEVAPGKPVRRKKRPEPRAMAASSVFTEILHWATSPLPYRVRGKQSQTAPVILQLSLDYITAPLLAYKFYTESFCTE